jgi:hypothetical protein
VRARIEALMARFPMLKRKAIAQASTLSGGEQKLLEIARGCCSSRSSMLIDEPSIGLSPLLVQDIFAILQDLRAGGMSILMVEQNAKRALEISDLRRGARARPHAHGGRGARHPGRPEGRPAVSRRGLAADTRPAAAKFVHASARTTRRRDLDPSAVAVAGLRVRLMPRACSMGMVLAFSALQDLVVKTARARKPIRDRRPVAHQAAGFHELGPAVHAGNPRLAAVAISLAAIERERIGKHQTASNFAARSAAKARARSSGCAPGWRDFRRRAGPRMSRSRGISSALPACSDWRAGDALRARQQLLQHFHPLGAQLVARTSCRSCCVPGFPGCRRNPRRRVRRSRRIPPHAIAHRLGEIDRRAA